MSILSGFKRFRKYVITDGGYIPAYEKTLASVVVMGNGTDESQTVETEIENLKKYSWKTLTATLDAGSTSVSFVNEAITSDSTIDIYTDVYGVNPTNVSVSGTTLTITFDAQTTAVSVKVRIM